MNTRLFTSDVAIVCRQIRQRRVNQIYDCIKVGILPWFGFTFFTIALGSVAMNCCECGGESHTARNQAFNIVSSIKIFKVQEGRYPTSLRELAVSPSRRQAIMERVPNDPWGNEFIYLRHGRKNVGFLEVLSKGPDGIFGSEDDCGNFAE